MGMIAQIGNSDADVLGGIKYGFFRQAINRFAIDREINLFQVFKSFSILLRRSNASNFVPRLW